MPSLLTRLRARELLDRGKADLLDVADSAARRWVREETARARVDRALGTFRRPPRHRLAPLLEAFAELNPRARFAQIGSNEDSARNPLVEIVRRYQWEGIIVEPIPHAFERLSEAYEGTPRITVVQAAIASEDGERVFYFIGPAMANRSLNGSGPATFTGSLQREAVFLPPNFVPDIDERISEITVRCLTVNSLMEETEMTRLDVLRVDTEGDEAEIIDQADLERLRPAIVCCSQRLLGQGDRNRCAQRLRGSGYEVLTDGSDIWAFSPRWLPEGMASPMGQLWRWIVERGPGGRPLAATRLLRAAMRPVLGGVDRNREPSITFPLNDHERRYLLTGYDDRTPLPPDASSYLSDENPRLLALRDQYAALDTPAVSHHLWSSDRVSENVDLRYFRGDNLYQWHYPEHPRAMALKLFLYLRYLTEQGGQPLLDLLSEDGAFGCWTTEVHGYGGISRDLLDSVNEIRFLDRHLGVLQWKGLRVLDIGAGYGRLAHRATTALPLLSDYCCVDAVPESTFLCEYYLRFRGCSPRARVLELQDVPNLKPGNFDLAVNVHSFSECTISAVGWWIDQLARLRVPHLFVVPNEADGILSRELDGSFHSVLPLLEAAGYLPVAKERAIADRAIRELLMLNDNFYLFSLTGQAPDQPVQQEP